MGKEEIGTGYGNENREKQFHKISPGTAYFTGSHTQNAPNGVRPSVFLKPFTTEPAGVLSFGLHVRVPKFVGSPGPIADLICGACGGAGAGAGGASDSATPAAANAAAADDDDDDEDANGDEAVRSINELNERRTNSPLNVQANVLSLVLTP